ncbi:hypothetical protein ALI22I_39070 [Saccharothrix sp. ALI-22-I]|uniref:hypothetical protein n=1 Tax=Saccharothrix sp. ALI-22-I TaxID=1933778 RepID=UPI0009D2D894|nr:hypothetical protein [Saccharothrix sp. ALI-22-I]ONI82149.1 hypothetical protein ALI22I_39070 [Saccharothrix sp. ALI-22-I]
MDMGVEIQRKVLAIIEGSRDFREIRTLLDAWQAEGIPADRLVDELTDLMLDLRAQNRADEEDAVVDVLDVLTDW